MDLPAPLPLLLALAPALVAIILALSTRKVILSLFCGVVAGAVVAHLPEVASGQVLDAILALFAYLVDAVVPGTSDLEPMYGGEGNLLLGVLDGDASALDTSHLVITAFSLLVAGMVGVLSRSGGTRALVGLVERLARGPRGAQVAAWLSGAIVFFDDYANCLVVGSAMGPLFDRFRVSRAKLAYIVDSTAAPVASLAIVSTWVGYEVGLIGDELVKAGSEESAFAIFLAALPYRFYGFVTLAMVGAIAFGGRDFGPMLAAERAARSQPRPVADAREARTGKAWAAAIPVVLLVFTTFAWLVGDGMRSVYTSARNEAVADGIAHPGQAAWEALVATPWFDVIGSADPFAALLWASVVGLVVAVGLAVLSGSLKLTESPKAAWAGMSPVLDALAVLFLAWALGNAMSDTGAAKHLKDLLAPSDTIAFEGAPVDLRWHAGADGDHARLQVEALDGRVVHREDLGTLDVGRGRVSWDGAGAEPGVYRIVVEATDRGGEPVDILVRGTNRFPPWLLPAAVFLVAAGTAFATGTSFGTMGILIPLVVPLGVGLEVGEPGPILLGSIAAVLAGAILGDHASPISDTTVLSALGAGVDLVEHVRTQLPYALIAGAISVVAGYVPAGLGVSPWLLVPLGCGLAIGVVFLFGRKPGPPRIVEAGEDMLAPEKPASMGYER